MLTGLNHLTLAVNDLHRSVAFYQGLLGMKLHATWDRGAYLSAAELWLCLSLDQPPRAAPHGQAAGYTHYAFSIAADQLDAFVARLNGAGVRQWNDNSSEGASWYFLDPDGHQLEAHVGDLATRLAACRLAPYPGMTFHDEPAAGRQPSSRKNN